MYDCAQSMRNDTKTKFRVIAQIGLRILDCAIINMFILNYLIH